MDDNADDYLADDEHTFAQPDNGQARQMRSSTQFLQICRRKGRGVGDHAKRYRHALPRNIPIPAGIEKWR